LPEKWATPDVAGQDSTRQLGDDWLQRKSSVVLSVPSVTSGERNFLLNPEHPQFRDLRFHDPVPFYLDARLLRTPVDQIRLLKQPLH
jgi:RES domain-containing protein